MFQGAGPGAATPRAGQGRRALSAVLMAAAERPEGRGTPSQRLGAGGQRGQGLPDLPWTDPSLTLPGAQQKRQDGGGVHGEVGVQRIWR